MDTEQKKKLVKTGGKLLGEILKRALTKQMPKSNNMGAPVPPPQPGCGACGPRK